MKRLLDIIVSGLGLLLLSPLLACVGIAVKLGSPGPVFFRQQRVGIHFRPFSILKFRTMVTDAPRLGGLITVGADPRITRVGRLLRKTKIDELPQLFNVLRGEMSLVGPRPEVSHYVDMFRRDYEEILSVRPGITDLASIQYRDESSILANAEHPDEEYVGRILPEKIRLAKEYVRRRSLSLDLAIISGTVLHLTSDMLPRSRCLRQRRDPRSARLTSWSEGQETNAKEEYP
jgi:lipopolysaccharide/colanic/teichoic acid biosynthesis glycosyltransferase